ncbi:hypothetical protein ACFL6F_02125 [Planctomycetota bacterium]
MLINDIEIKIASSSEELQNAYNLVYRNYIEKGFCKLDINRMRIYLFDSLPDTRTFIAKKDNTVIATATLVFNSSVGLPSSGVFEDLISDLSENTMNLCEISKLAVDQNMREIQQLKVLSLLFRSCWLYALHFSPATHFLIMVEPKHQPFYEKHYFFKSIGDTRKDPHASNTPSALLLMPLDVKEQAYKESDSTRGEKRLFFYYNDPNVPHILKEIKETENHFKKIKNSLKSRQSSSTLALSSDEKEYMEFKLFIIEYNILKIDSALKITLDKGKFREAIESYEKLLSTVPSWAFRRKQAEIMNQIGLNYFYLGDYNKLEVLCTKAERMSADPGIVADSKRIRAYVVYFIKGFDQAIALLDEAENLVCDIKGKELVRVYLAKVILYKDREDFKQASEYIEKAERIVSDLRKETSLKLVVMHNSFLIKARMTDYSRALSVLDTYRRDINAFSADDHFAKAFYFEAEGRFSEILSKYLTANTYFIKAKNMFEIADNPLNSAIMAYNITSNYVYAGKLEQAKQAFSEAESLLPEENRNPGLSHQLTIIRGLLSFMDGNEHECKLIFKETGKELKKNIKTLPLRIMRSFTSSYEMCLNIEGRHKEALALLEKCLETTDESGPVSSLQISRLKHLILTERFEKARHVLESLYTAVLPLDETYFFKEIIEVKLYHALMNNTPAEETAGMVNSIFSHWDHDENEFEIIRLLSDYLRTAVCCARAGLCSITEDHYNETVHLLNERIEKTDMPALKKHLKFKPL